eukprot:s1511_g19.t1
MEVMKFMKHVVGLDCDLAAFESAWVSGIIRAAQQSRPLRKQSTTLSVKTLLFMEEYLCDKSKALVDRYACGVFLFAIYARARFGDLRKISKIWVDSAPTSSECSLGFIEAHSESHKMRATGNRLGAHLPLIAPIKGARAPAAKRRPAAAIKRGGKGRCKRATVRPVRKPSLKKDSFAEVVFLPARPDKPLPPCGWARSKPDGKIWFAPYNANFAKTKPLNLKVQRTKQIEKKDGTRVFSGTKIFKAWHAKQMASFIQGRCFMALENVLALLSCNENTRALMAYAGRGRVFLLCADRKAKLWEARCSHIGLIGHVLLSQTTLQGYECLPAADHCVAEWNPLNAKPMHTWLNPTQKSGHSARLKMLGNSVVPAQAKLAFETLLSLHRRARESAFDDEA